MEKLMLSSLENKNFSKAVNEIYLLTDYNHKQYPEYYKWYYQKSIPRIFDETGDILFYLDGLTVAGLAILKNDEIEKKICTFMVNEDYRRQGLGHIMMEEAFKYLETDKPLITIPTKRLDEFSSIIKAYNFLETSRCDDYLTEEVVFNDFKVKKIKR